MRGRTRTGAIGRSLLWAVAAPIAALGLYAIAAPVFEFGGVSVPRAEFPPIYQLSQGWDANVTNRFHHESQGTKIMPLEWLLALEQPVFTPFPGGPVRSARLPCQIWIHL